MSRGGKRPGAGRKPRVKHYQPRESVGKDLLWVGWRCEQILQARYETVSIVGKPGLLFLHDADDPRPHINKQIITQVAKEVGESERMVEQLWEEYRRVTADLKRDLGD
jgi:hypothetical protein